ncbi:MAG TPA: hypothetical protein VEW47_15790 [Candidatus Dormibacteraeota bacterium]|nr:hypothetical protein [Candidatus Dormibacteraeota bacterium]
MRVSLRGACCTAALLRAGLALACLIVSPATASAQADRPAEETLLSLQERGRLIALYLQAVDRTADLLKAQGSGAPPSDRTVVLPDSAGWRVVCLKDLTKEPGMAAPARGGLSIVGETTFSPDSGQVGTLGLIVPPRSAPATIQAYSRALDEAESATLSRPEAGPPFVDAVIREKDSTFTVYVISQKPDEAAPAPATPPSIVIGRDFIVRVAANGRQVLSVDRLHDSVASLSLLPRAPGAPLLHEHDKGDLPAPTDVALVMRQPVLAPLLVLTGRFMFRVDREGGVTWLGPNPTPLVKPAPSPPPPGRGGAR